jgi:hypothetical protein
MDMIKIENFTTRFQVVAIHRQTGKVQFASIYAPTQVDADDFVADFQPDWIVVRSGE